MTTSQHRHKAFSLRKTVLIVVLSLTGVFAASGALASKGDRHFVNEASIGNQFEIESSRLALQQSQSDDVKTFAQHMVDDHTRIGSDMTAVLAKTDGQIPTPDNKLDSAHQKILNKLTGLSGADFDHLYIKSQTKAHDDAIALFGNYAAHGQNAALKNFAMRTLPIIKQHRNDIPQA